MIAITIKADAFFARAPSPKMPSAKIVGNMIDMKKYVRNTHITLSHPSFKAINWKTKKSIPRFLVIFVVLVFTAINYEWMPAILFLAYLLYGFLRPWLSREWRREIEEEIGEEGSDEPTEQPS